MVPCQREMCNAALAFLQKVSHTRERHVVSVCIAIDVSDSTLAAFITAVTAALGYEATNGASADVCGRSMADIIVCETLHEPRCGCAHLPRIVLSETLTLDSVMHRTLPANEIRIAKPFSAHILCEALGDLAAPTAP